MNLEDDLPYKGSLKKAKNRRKLVPHNPENLDPNLFGEHWRLMYKHEIKAHKQIYVAIQAKNGVTVSFTHNGRYNHSKTYFVEVNARIVYGRKGYSEHEVTERVLQYIERSDKRTPFWYQYL